MKTLLEQRLDSKPRGNTKKSAQDVRELIVPLVPDDAKPHQTARRWVPRDFSNPNATLARCAMPRVESETRELLRARSLIDEFVGHAMRYDARRRIHLANYRTHVRSKPIHDRPFL